MPEGPLFTSYTPKIFGRRCDRDEPSLLVAAVQHRLLNATTPPESRRTRCIEILEGEMGYNIDSTRDLSDWWLDVKRMHLNTAATSSLLGPSHGVETSALPAVDIARMLSQSSGIPQAQ